MKQKIPCEHYGTKSCWQLADFAGQVGTSGPSTVRLVIVKRADTTLTIKYGNVQTVVY